MKGLLLKDWYVIKKTCGMLLVLYAIFLIAIFFNGFNSFFFYYPAIFAGLLPVSILTAEEKEQWTQYAETLPISRAGLVSETYILTLLCSGIITLLSTLVVIVSMLYHHDTDGSVLLQIGTILPICLLPAALNLPFQFRYGTQKGKIAFLVILGLFVCLVLMLISGSELLPALSRISEIVPLILLILGLIAFPVSWLISIRIYQKREL